MEIDEDSLDEDSLEDFAMIEKEGDDAPSALDA